MISATSILICQSTLNATIRSMSYFVRFAVGDTACVLQKTNVGKIQNVYIKEVQIPETSGGIPPLYKDTFNTLWNDSELILPEEAQQLAEGYLNARITVLS